MQHSLFDESTYAASVLDSWCDFPGIIPIDEILRIRVSKAKAKRELVEIFRMVMLR
jgi:hypothetical protein